jgi:transcription termination factor Rho
MPMGVQDSMEFLLGKLKDTKNNADFFESMNS